MPDDVSALCAACHEICQSGAAARSWSAPGCRTCRPCCRRASPTPSGCSATRASTGSTAQPPTSRCASPAGEEDADFDDDALDAMYEATGGYPYFIQAYGKTVWDVAPALPDHGGRRRRRRARGRARAGRRVLRLALRAGDAGEREYLRAMAEVDGAADDVATSAVAEALGRSRSRSRRRATRC